MQVSMSKFTCGLGYSGRASSCSEWQSRQPASMKLWAPSPALWRAMDSNLQPRRSGCMGFRRGLVFVERHSSSDLSLWMNQTRVARRHSGFARKGPAWAGHCKSVRSCVEQSVAWPLFELSFAVSNPEKKSCLRQQGCAFSSVGSPTVRELQTGCTQNETVFCPKVLQHNVKLERKKLSQTPSLSPGLASSSVLCEQLPGALAPYKAWRKVQHIKHPPSWGGLD